jgi:glycosyltransferase involved in cell wall biosynthesis
MVDISAIICCYNSEARIEATINYIKLAAVTSNYVAIEIIVVNNNSTDDTEGAANSILNKSPVIPFQIIRENQRGLAYARLAGVRVAAGRHLCFIDDDNWPSDRYFEVVARVFRDHPDVGVIGCSTRLPDGMNVPQALLPLLKSYAVGDLFNHSGLLPRGAYVWGAGMAVRASAMKAIIGAGFAPVLTGRSGAVQLAGDDAELSLILCIAGWRAWYERSPLIVHAIDAARFSIDRVKTMHTGFGVSFPVIKRYWRIDKGENWASSRLYYAVVLIRIPVTLLRVALACYAVFRTNSPADQALLAEKCGRLDFYLYRGDLYQRQRRNVLAVKNLRVRAGL